MTPRSKDLAADLLQLESEFGESFNFIAEATRQLSVKVATGEEGMLVEVLEKHLGRLITTDDFKDCQMKYPVGRPDEYLFAYKGVDLGWIKKEIKMGGYEESDFTLNQFKIVHEISFHPVKSAQK